MRRWFEIKNSHPLITASTMPYCFKIKKGEMTMNNQELLQLIKERKSTRAFDSSRVIEPDVLRNILEAAAHAPTGHNMQNFQIVVINDKQVLSALGELEISFTPAFIQWNYHEVSFSEDELKKKKTGMLASQFPPSWFTPEVREGKIDPNQLKGKLNDILGRSTTVMLLLFDPKRGGMNPSGEPNDIMSLGFMLENVWLMAHAQGVGVRIVSAFASESVESEVKKILGIPSPLKIAIGCCLGYPADEDADNLRVCRDVEDFVFFNRYKIN